MALSGRTPATTWIVENGAGGSVPDLTFISTAIVNWLSRKRSVNSAPTTCPSSSSVVQMQKVERDYRAGRRSYAMADWSAFSQCLDQDVANTLMDSPPLPSVKCAVPSCLQCTPFLSSTDRGCHYYCSVRMGAEADLIVLGGCPRRNHSHLLKNIPSSFTAVLLTILSTTAEWRDGARNLDALQLSSPVLGNGYVPADGVGCQCIARNLHCCQATRSHDREPFVMVA